MIITKPYSIPKNVVFEAWKQVKKNKGSAGIDGQSIESFETNLQDNLYKIWNRMSSGSYMPKAVRLCEIPKSDGKIRILGIPTVSDRVAQMTVKMILEPSVDKIFHEDSYGYRPAKSAKDALEVARKRCWQMNWVIDLDIKGFFDNIDHSLMMKAVERHTKEPWILLYVKRWLSAPAQGKDGKIKERDKGTPQGGVISPLLANLFLHYAFDSWMVRKFGELPFERYADDILVHCYTEKQALYVLKSISQRLKECGLNLHPDKTKIAYCKDDNRKGTSEHIKFDFLGYQFRPRRSKNNQTGQMFDGFNPAISPKATKAIGQTIRSWELPKRSPMSLIEISDWINPIVRGWINYYGAFCKSELLPILRQIEYVIAKWAIRKFKRFHRKLGSAYKWLASIAKREPNLFAHWVN